MKSISFLSIICLTLILSVQVLARKPISNTAWIGMYSGKFPCKDCKGVQYKLSLNPDYSYQEELTYIGKTTTPVITYGKYNITTKAVLVLTSKAETDPYKYFSKHETGLRLLDSKGKVIYGTHADKYILVKEEEKQGQHYPIPEKKMLEGVDFYGFGNAPAWTLDMDFQKSISINIEAEKIDIIHVPVPVKLEDNVAQYHSITPVRETIITIKEGMCKTKGSEDIYNSKVLIDTRKTGTKDFQHLEGCGNYVPDARLNNIWVVKSLYQKKLDQKTLPTIEFHLRDNSIMGNTGCNSYSGETQYLGNKIIIGQLISTLMACPEENNTEAYFLKILNGKTLTYKFEDSFLKLYDNKVEVLVLKNID